MFSAASKNTFFTSSFSEASYYMTLGYLLDGGDAGKHHLQGYVFATQQPGTVPLCRLFEQSTRNTFFSSSLEEVQYYRDRYGYQLDGGTTSYILGYVYPNNPNYQYDPIYRLYNSHDRNTFMTTSYDEALFYMRTYNYLWDGGVTSYIQGYLLGNH